MSEEQKAREDEVFNQELSLEDLDAAAGGRVLHHKDNRIKEADLHNCIERHCRPIYGPDGNSFPYCAATVEDGSWCDSNDACYTDQSVRYEGRKDCAKAWR